VAGRCSTFTDSNPAFGKTHETLDWGEVVANGVRLAFREVGRVCRFRIRAASPSSCWSSFDAIHAALSFLFGCRVRLRGWQFSSQVDMENVLLGNRPTAMRRVYPPLDNFLWQRRGDLTGFEKPLALAWAFFLTPIGQTIRPLLYLVWDSADLALESRLLNSATALEGMVRALERDHGTPLPYADKVIAYLEGLNIAAADLARWRGLVGGTGQLHVPTVLRRWVSEGRYLVREEELKAFSRQRHPLAHGSMLNDAGDGAAKQDLALLMNLINKVLLSDSN